MAVPATTKSVGVSLSEFFGPTEARMQRQSMLLELRAAGPLDEGKRAAFISDLVRKYAPVEDTRTRSMPGWWKAAIISDDKSHYGEETVQRANERLRAHVSDSGLKGELEALIKVCGGAERLAVLAEVVVRRYQPSVNADEALPMLADKLAPLEHVLDEARGEPNAIPHIASALDVEIKDIFTRGGKPRHGVRTHHSLTEARRAALASD